MIEFLEKKIDDKRIVNVIRKMLKAGYLEAWRFNNTWSGTPQGGVISPILANIYLHELDIFMEDMMFQFNRGKRRKPNPAYTLLGSRMQIINQKLQRLKMVSEHHNSEKSIHKSLLRTRRELQEQMHRIPDFII
jgi:retron-type reverse transcriptase